jgi:hypothetical protein
MKNRKILTVDEAMVLQRAQKLSTNLIERANIVLPKRMNVVQ